MGSTLYKVDDIIALSHQIINMYGYVRKNEIDKMARIHLKKENQQCLIPRPPYTNTKKTKILPKQKNKTTKTMCFVCCVKHKNNKKTNKTNTKTKNNTKHNKKKKTKLGIEENSMKKKILVRGPALSQTGYGEQCRFALRALRSREDLFDIYLMNIPWGGSNWIFEDNDFICAALGENAAAILRDQQRIYSSSSRPRRLKLLDNLFRELWS